MSEKTITYEQIEQRLKNKPKEQWTKDDVFDRYVGYGSPEEIENPEVQKLFIKHGLYDELINLVNNVITDKEVVEKILKSNIFKKELKKIFDKGKVDLNDKNNIFLKCKISEQEAINGCTKKIKFIQVCENGKKKTTEMDVKIPKGIKKDSSIIFYDQGNYIKELNKRSNIIIRIEIK